jgi:hypothetical protein
MSVAIVAAGGVHEIAAEADQYPILPRQIELYRRDLEAASEEFPYLIYLAQRSLPSPTQPAELGG